MRCIQKSGGKNLFGILGASCLENVPKLIFLLFISPYQKPCEFLHWMSVHYYMPIIIIYTSCFDHPLLNYRANWNQTSQEWCLGGTKKILILSYSVKDIFVYCLKNDSNSLHNVTVSWTYRSLLYVIFLIYI
jgi:hypothetical protein